MGTGFDRLHPVVQHHIVNSMGWPSLRPLQEESIAPILDGEHVLALAPTAGGKTEAAVLPLLSQILTQRWSGLSVIYLCPLRALLNNLYERLERYGSYCGVRVGLWHGDVGAGARNRIKAEQPDILLTTPESLEAMLISVGTDHRRMFADVRVVVVDEVHAFGGDDRGWHMLAVLERLTALAGRDLQRIGLSATVGDPERLLRWLAGSSTSASRVVAPGVTTGGPPAAADVTLDHVGSVANAAVVISQLHHGEKRLVFCDSRARVEELGALLRGHGVATFVSHSSLAAGERREAERAFAEATNCVIVATSTLELGIDVGDLDRVIQLDSPGTVASFLQRLGRSGRRAGTSRNMLFLTTGDGLQCPKAAALLHLWGTGYVEPIVAPPLPLHLFAQQLLAIVLQDGSIGRNLWAGRMGRLPVFAEAIERGDAVRIVDHLVETGMLVDDNGMLSVGPHGERSYGYRHFVDLTSMFTSPPLFTVRHGRHDLGLLDPTALRRPDRSFAAVLLAGRSWQVTSIDWKRRVAWVEPSESKGRSRWIGAGQGWSPELCDATRTVLCGTDPAYVTLTERARRQLAAARAEFSWARPDTTAVVHGDGGTRWWTWAGQRANATLAAALGDLAGDGRADNLSIPVDDGRGTMAAIAARLAAVDVEALTPGPVVEDLAQGLKFSDCLPRDLAHAVVSARLLDRPGMARVFDELPGMEH